MFQHNFAYMANSFVASLVIIVMINILREIARENLKIINLY